MNVPRVTDIDYIQFLVAAQRVSTCTEAAHCALDGTPPPAHDAYVRLLHRPPPNTAALWQEGASYVQPARGLLIVDARPLTSPMLGRWTW
jgi:hypothetical protein